MHLHNGKPLWCRPAPTKSGAIWTPEDEDEETVALSELPGLIAKAIKAGLVQKPADAPNPFKAIAAWQRGQCEQCGGKFLRNHKRHVWCEPCRNPPIPCYVCKQPFRKKHSKQTACSVECSKERQRSSFLVMAEKKRKPVKLTECIICKQMHPVRPAGSSTAKTCGKECAAVYRKLRATDSNQFRAKEKRENKA